MERERGRMRDVWSVARTDLRVRWREGRLPLVVATVAVLLGLAWVVGTQNAAREAAERAQAEATQWDLWLNQPDRNPHGAAHDGLMAIRGVPPLASIDRGIDGYAGTVIPLEAHGSQHARVRPAADAPGLQRFGELTVATVLQLVLPLLLIVLGYDAYAGEREGGTLRLLLASGVRPRTLARGKLLAFGGVVAGIAGMALLAPVVSALAAAGESGVADSEILARGVLVGLVHGAYLMGFGALVLAVSAVARSARSSLLVLLVLWVVGSFVAPRLSAAGALWLAPTESGAEFGRRVARDLEGGIDGHAPWDERAKAFEAQVLAEYGVDTVDDLPVNFDGLLLQADEDYSAEVYSRHTRALWAGWLRQERLQLVLSAGAPVLAVRGVSSAMAGTGLGGHAHFTAAAETYRQSLIRLLNEDMTVNSRTGDWDYRAGVALWSAVPAFEYRPPPVRAVLAEQRLGIVFLLAWTVLSVLAAALAVRTRAVQP